MAALKTITLVLTLSLAAQIVAAADSVCDITATGAVTASIHATVPMPKASATAKEFVPFNKNSSSSDYWLQTSTADTVAKISGKPSTGAFHPFVISCGDETNHVNIFSPDKSRKEDYPYGPKKYPLVTFFAAKSGEMALQLATINGQLLHIKDTGTVDITKFDNQGISGTISFTASLYSKASEIVHVKVSFAHPCYGDKCG